MTDHPTEPCGNTQPHPRHRFMRNAKVSDCPGAAPRLDVLIDRACRHLTPQEANALRGGIARLRNEGQRLEERVRDFTDGAADREALLTEARDALEDAGAGGHGNDWPHLAPGIRALYARAERAEQQAAQVRALHARNANSGTCEHCSEHDYPDYAVTWPCATIRALDAAGQPDTPAGECGYVDGDRRCINRPGHDNPRRVHGPWVTHTAQHAREDGHAGACGATRATDAPGADETAPGRHTPAQDRDEWAAIIAAEVDPDYAAQKLLALRDRDRAAHDKWTRAVEQRNTRLRAEHAALKRAHRALAEQAGRTQRELAEVRAEIDRTRPADEVLPHELLRLLDMRKYVSTACDTAGACETATGDHTDDADQLTDQAAQLHARCRRTHKFTGQLCGCDCHHTTAKETSR